MQFPAKEDHLKTQDGILLFTRTWRPQEPRAVVCIVHGYAEHSSRYTKLIQHLLQHDYAVFAYDHRGHGKSEGLRAYIPRYEKLYEDLCMMRDKVTKLYPDLPLFFLGQSMGGGLLTYAAIKDSDFANGMILCSSALKVKHKHPIVNNLLGWLTSATIPKLEIPRFLFNLDAKDLSRREKEVSDYEKDPFVYHGGMRNRTGWEMMRAMRFIQRRQGRVLTPFLAMHGDCDRIADVEGSKKLYEKAACEDKTLRVFEGAYHELFFDETADEALAQTTDWLAKHLPAGA